MSARAAGSVAIFLLLFVAGTSRGDVASADIDGATVTPEYVAAQPRDKVESILYAMIDVVMERVIGACDQRQGTERDKCIDETLLLAFENDGVVGRNCKARDPGEDHQRCVMMGTRLVPVAKAVGADPATLIDWSDLEDTRSVFNKLIDVIDDRCKPATTVDELIECSIGARASLLGLSPAVAERCQEQGEIEDMTACVHDALDAAIYQTAIQRLSS
jgi:hypothetical protein